MSDVIVLANSDRSGYIRRDSLTRTIETPCDAVGGQVHPGTPVFGTASCCSPQRLQVARELGAPAVDSGLHRAFRQSQPVGNFLIGQLLDVAQHHRGAQRRREPIERVPEEVDAVALLELGVCARGRAPLARDRPGRRRG